MAGGDEDRGVQNRGLTNRPPAAGKSAPRGNAATDEALARVSQRFKVLEAEEELPKVYRYAYPDGRQYEIRWQSDAAAKAWASQMQHRYLGRVAGPPPVEPTPRSIEDRSTQNPTPPSPPPPGPAPLPGPPPPPPPAPVPPPPAPRPKKRRPPIKRPVKPEPTPVPPPPPPPAPPPKPKREPVPPPVPDEYNIVDYLKEDFLHTTMTESMPLITSWFGTAGEIMEKVPGLQGMGRAYSGIAKVAEGLQLVYELVHELDQGQALEKGSKQLVKRTKPVKVVAESLLKRKFPKMPEGARKKTAAFLEKLFEKYVADPAIESGGKKLRKEVDLNDSLWKDLKEALGSGTAAEVPP